MKKQYSFLLAGITILSIITFIEADAGPATVPDKPDDFKADDISPTKIELSWNPPDDDGGSPIIGYKIEYWVVEEGGTFKSLVTDTGNVNTYSHTGLQKGNTYIYQIFSINVEGFSDDASQAVAKVTSSSAPPEDIPPNPITDLTATDISQTIILVSWDKPAANNGPAVTGYKIERKTTGSFTTLVADTGDALTTYTNSGLTTGTTYTYKVYAINSVGLSNSTGEASATPTTSSAPPAGTEAPRTPRSFKAEANSNTEIGLTWQEPAEFQGPPVTGYKLELKKPNETEFTELVANTGLVLSYQHTGLESGKTYTYRLSALNSIGASNTVQSSAFPVHTQLPTNLIAEDVSPTQIKLSWKAPSQTYGGKINGYEIEEKIGLGVYEEIESITGTETSVTLTGLQTDKTYTLRVKASFTAGSSPWSDDVSATPTATSGPSFFAPDAPPTLTITNDSPTANTLLWVKPSEDGGKPITGYKIEYKVDAGDWKVLVSDTKSTGTTYTHKSLPSGEEFFYKVYAINSVGTSTGFNTKNIKVDQSAPVSKLGRPQGLTLTSPSPSQVNLAWLAPDDDGGKPITGYKIEYKIDIGNYKAVLADTKTISTKYEHKELKDAGTYYYRVYAINSAGTGDPSNPVSLIIQSDEPDPEPQEKKAPSFIDTSNDAQYYIDRYNDDPAYKDWFDTNYSDYTFDEAIALAYPEPEPDPEPVPDPEPEPEPKAKPKKDQKPILPFVDETKDPQYYIDRYNNEETYMEWFDSTFPDYTIEEAVGLVVEEPSESKPILDFVDQTKDPQYYIDRYNNEPAYKNWFDKNHPDYTIEEAVGLGMEDEMSKQCGPGTVFKNGVCVLEKTGGGCLIATAAFGSELSPQVQLLREIRDNSVLSTQSGTSFMTGFNQFYYSFSPTIADWERQNSVFKEMVRISITPLLTSLSILEHVDVDSESAILGYGIGIILLNIGMYFGAPVFAIWLIRNRF